jgi:hypothetical protein
MSSLATGLIVFAFVFGGALFGMFLRAVLPENHLGNDSKDVVKIGMGLVATMSALVLSLVISSAKSSYDAQSVELTEASAKVILLDRMLAHYGPETKEARATLRTTIQNVVATMWQETIATPTQTEKTGGGSEALYDKIQGLDPKDEKQKTIQAQALTLLAELAQTRWLLFEQRASALSLPLLVILVFWLTTLFISFGLFAPRNATVVASLVISALSVGGAIFLMLEMYSPYTGIIRLSSAPLKMALAHLGQ